MNNIIDNLEKLKHFIGLDGTSSLRQASLKLHMTQGALSKSIIALEESIGVKLLTRHNSGITLTKEGLELMEFSKKVFTDCLQIQSRLRGIGTVQEKLKIRIGVYDSIAVYFFPKLLNFISQVHHGLEISSFVGPSSIIEEKIYNKEIDLAIGVNIGKDQAKNKKYDILKHNLFKDQFSFYLHPKKEIEANNLPLIWFPEASDYDGKSCFEYMKKHLKKKSTYDCSNMETVKEICLSGAGVALLPTRVASIYTKDRRLINITLPGLQKSFGEHEITLLHNNNSIFQQNSRLIEDMIELACSAM